MDEKLEFAVMKIQSHMSDCANAIKVREELITEADDPEQIRILEQEIREKDLIRGCFERCLKYIQEGK